MAHKSAKFETVIVFFFELACERVFIKMHSIESRCYRTGKYTVCRRVRASFSPEILQAGTVKGLSFMGLKKNDKDEDRRTLNGYVDAVLKKTQLITYVLRFALI